MIGTFSTYPASIRTETAGGAFLPIRCTRGRLLRSRIKARSSMDELEAGNKVSRLLSRDFIKVELRTDAFEEGPEVSVDMQATEQEEPPGESFSSNLQQEKESELFRKQSTEKYTHNGPRRSREAIDLGLKLFQQSKYQEAVNMFQLALELPGTGVVRLGGSPREIACPSEGEENAALYNMACAYCRMQPPRIESALICLEAVLENGFDDVNAIRSDEDLLPLQGRALEDLLQKHNGFIPSILGSGKMKGYDNGNNKPWLLW